MYDLEVTIKRGASRPVLIRRIETPERVQQIVESFHAAWGLPFPDRLAPRGELPLLEQVAHCGAYLHDDDASRVVVKRSPAHP